MTDALLKRELPALHTASGSSPSDIHDKPPAMTAVPLSPSALWLTDVSPVLPRGHWGDLSYTEDSQMFQIWWSHAHAREIRFLSNNWALWCPRAHNLCLPFRNEEDCTFPILAALLRVTGLVAECLYHSLCTASSHPPPPPQPPRPSSTSHHHHMCPLWNGNAGPLKTVNLKQITAALMLM